ncbi:transcriptional regulator [Pandoraea capi]|nr:transcriptional regulator [Pandoraea sp. LA3]MDN4583873.1 transcriptional regulator [Pandoraea capi]
MTTFSDRLKAERKRIGLSQEQFAVHGGVKRDAQINYENGSRKPDSGYLEAISALGVDVLYLVTGRHDVTQMSADELDLVRRYRDAPDVVKAAAIAALTAGAAPSSSKYQMNFGGATIGNQNVGDVSVKTRKVVGVDKKK